MAEQLKYMYNPAFFEKLCPVMRSTIPGFDCKDFIFRVFNNQWPDLELKQRIRHISTVLRQFMPASYPEAAGILTRLAAKLKTEMPEQNFITIFIPNYVEVFGLDYPNESLHALGEITKLVSAEFAIRPFIVKYPQQTMDQMLQWSRHENANVRRLATEGCRPRLPWGIGLANFKKDPTPILPILENLKADPSEYVRRSVANNLNDIAKDHPKLILQVFKKWKGENPNTDWILKHGCRTLLKKGDATILRLHGFNPSSKSKVEHLAVSKKKLNIGEAFNFNFDFISEEKTSKVFRLEYAIDYLTSTGKLSRKVFKISESKFYPNKPVSISRKQSFKNLTTRKHYKGKHALSILVNGNKAASLNFTLC